MSSSSLKLFFCTAAFLTTFSLTERVEARCADTECYPTCDHRLPGTYFTCGYDPYEDKKFEGTLVVKHLGSSVYEFDWTFVGGATKVGTGIYDKHFNVIAVNFGDSIDSSNGVEIFRVTENRIIGHWTKNNQTLIGRETLIKIQCF